MVSKSQGREKLMEIERCFKNDGMVNTCLCLHDKNQYVIYVMSQCQLTTEVYIAVTQYKVKLISNRLLHVRFVY